MGVEALTTHALASPSTRPDWREIELTRSILESSHEAFVSIDAAGTVIAWNQAAEQTFGWSREEACGRSMAELIIPERYREAHYRGVQRFLESGKVGFSGRRLELAALHRDGREVPIELSIAPTRVGGATVFNAFLHDIGERRAAEAEVRRLAAIVETSDDAVMSGTLDGTVTSWNRGAEHLYGYSSEEMVGESISRVRPTGDLREASELQARLARGERIRDRETREIRKDGSSVDVSVSMSPLADESGRVVGVASIARDVTARKASERALQEAHARFQGAFEAAPIGMALVDLDGRFLSANAALCDLVGRSEEELTRLDVRAVTHQDDVDVDVEQVRRVLDGEIDRFELEKRYVRPDGTIAWGLLCVSLVRGPAGEPVHFVRQVQDITERKETEEQLREHLVHLNELALRDPLTGLPNQRDFDTAVDREIKRVRRHGGEFGVVVLDVDGFSRLNERRGRMEGDRVLRRLGTALTAVSRGSDVAARLRDDQFALLLPETAGEGAEATAERVRAEVSRLEPGVSLSHGTAVFPDAGDSKELLLLRADSALAAAKCSRDRDEEETVGIPPGVRERIGRILDLAREQLGMDVAFLGELVNGREVFRAVAGDGAAFGLETGVELPVSATYCRRMVDGQVPEVIPDTSSEREVAELAVTRDGGVAAYVGVPLHLSDGRLYGALCGVSSEPRADLSERSAELLRFLAGLVAELLDQAGDEERRRRAQVEFSGIQSLVAALEARDHYTGEHSKMVVALALAVANRLGLSEEEVLEVEQVAILHDIGKVGIPDALLQKRGPLTDEEWLLMRQHPAVGERIVASTESLSHLARAVRAEHEHYDGMGYPDGLRGRDIPIASRVCLACDAYHAMTSDRPYRTGISAQEARAQLSANAGTQFDPLVVDALLAVLAEPEPAARPR